MAHCTRAFGMGWSHAGRILFAPFRLGFWLKLTALHVFIWGMTNFHFQYEFVSGETLRGALENPERYAHLVPMILVGGAAFLIVYLFITFFSSAARLMFVDGVRGGNIEIGDSFSRLIGRIVSLFLWNMIVPTLGALLLAAALFALAVVFVPFEMALDPGTAGAGMALGFLAVILAAGGVVLIYRFYMEALVIPIMAAGGEGIFGAWGEAARLTFEDFGEMLGYFLVRLLIGIAVFVLLAVVAAMVWIAGLAAGYLLFGGAPQSLGEALALAAAMFPPMVVIQFFWLPVPVFKDAYALAFLAAAAGDERYGVGGKADNGQDGAESSEPPGAFPSPPPAPPSGPTQFRDIPPGNP